MTPKNTICLWFDKDAHEAAQLLRLPHFQTAR
jgi:predicted 3-demethylubiquinone-9 3-methyltransferase (glyoxalase superfamily)